MRKKILLVIIITIIVLIIGYIQCFPIIAKHPKKDFSPISIKDAKNNFDIDMTLSYLYNITKEKHPMRNRGKL